MQPLIKVAALLHRHRCLWRSSRPVISTSFESPAASRQPSMVVPWKTKRGHSAVTALVRSRGADNLAASIQNVSRRWWSRIARGAARGDAQVAGFQVVTLLDTPVVPANDGSRTIAGSRKPGMRASLLPGTFGLRAITDARLSATAPPCCRMASANGSSWCRPRPCSAEFAGRVLPFDSAAAEAHAPSAAVRRLAGRSLAGRCTDRVDCGISRGRHPTPQHCGLRGVWNRDGALLGSRVVIGPGYSTRGEILLQCGSARRVVRRADGLACRYQQPRPSEITFNQGCRPS